MLICIGEILVDMIGEADGDNVAFKRFAGGAPFNVACAAKNMGASVGFVGSVGDDHMGRYLREFAAARGFDYVDVRLDGKHNTTLAFVELDKSGERSFCFNRKHTADYHITRKQMVNAVKPADTVCMGTLMLSKKRGVTVADQVVDFAKKQGKRLCIDVNYREDIFKDKDVREVYADYIAAAEVIKFSEQELAMLVDGESLKSRLIKAAGKNKLACVTLGKDGSAFAFRGEFATVKSIKVKPVDTTGAGDAFFGCLLAQLDRKDLGALTTEQLINMFYAANKCGALATTKKGAIDSLPTYAQVFGE